jgi:hygromycin-B 4-O-kinase
MTKQDPSKQDVTEVQTFLADHLGIASSKLELVGQGAWSKCFGFLQGDEHLVIRYGQHVDDFYKDELAYQYFQEALPIPKVFEIGQIERGYYAISARAYGVPLESLGSKEWLATTVSLAAALEAMRTAKIASRTGYGGWGIQEQGEFKRWSDYLLAVATDSPSQRTYGWKTKLANYPEEAIFHWGYELLKQVADDSAPRSLLHSDLINRNVLVKDQQLSGVFDWGCSLYGDHLYDLAWLEFWSPWYPEMNLTPLKQELERLWFGSGYSPKNIKARLVASHLHIGLSHLAYNAYLANPKDLSATAKRMQALAGQLA